MSDIYKILADLDIIYDKYEHPPVFTCEEAEKYDRDIEAGKCKNLFLRNKKGDSHFLVIINSDKKIDLNSLAEKISESKLSFASEERLKGCLDLTTGAVSPFGLINDLRKEVQVIIDNDLLKYAKLSFHPNVNTASLIIGVEDFKKFLDWTSNRYKFLEL